MSTTATVTLDVTPIVTPIILAEDPVGDDHGPNQPGVSRKYYIYPTNIAFGLLPDLPRRIRDKKQRRLALAQRHRLLQDLEQLVRQAARLHATCEERLREFALEEGEAP